MRVLLICARDELAQPIVARLTQQGHQVTWASALCGQTECDHANHDTVIAAWPAAPDELLSSLRVWRTAAAGRTTLLVTSATDAVPVVRELHAQACQLIVDAQAEPTSTLLDRIADALSRMPHRADQRLRCGEVEFALRERKAWRNGRDVALTEREWAVIFALARTPGQSVDKPALATNLVGEACHPVNALEVHVAALRRKLGRELIETIRGRGYRLRR